MAEPLCYLYAIVRAAEPLPDVGLGVDETTVRTISRGPLAAVVSGVDRTRFGEESLRAKLEDLSWLEYTARAHHRVVDALARVATVAPLRMATILSDERGVGELLETHREEFGRVLDHIRGRQEWGVKAYATDPGPAQAQASAPGRPGTAYLMRKREQRDRAGRITSDAAERAQRLHETLTGHAADSRVYPAQDPRLSGRPEPMVLNAAYLLPADGAGPLRDAAAQFDSAGLRVELTGPWAPYSFAEVSSS
jgi:gas vesicle protein GvpL/GvpF